MAKNGHFPSFWDWGPLFLAVFTAGVSGFSNFFKVLLFAKQKKQKLADVKVYSRFKTKENRGLFFRGK